MALHQFAQVKTAVTTRDEWSRPYLRKGVKGDSCPIWIRDRLEPGSPSDLYSSPSQRGTLWGWWFHLFPGEPVPMLNHSSSKEIFPNIQPSGSPGGDLPFSISYLHACLKLKALHHVITGRAFIPSCYHLRSHRTPQGIPFTWWNISFFSRRGIKDGLFHIIPFCSSILKFCWTHSYSWLISLFFN